MTDEIGTETNRILLDIECCLRQTKRIEQNGKGSSIARCVFGYTDSADNQQKLDVCRKERQWNDDILCVGRPVLMRIDGSASARAGARVRARVYVCVCVCVCVCARARARVCVCVCGASRRPEKGDSVTLGFHLG